MNLDKFIVCVHDSDYSRVFYAIKPKWNERVKAKDIKEIVLNRSQTNKLKAICKYKQQFNGKGEDPKCKD